MITASEIKARMTARPFVPFRVCLSDGKTDDISNHDRMFLSRHCVSIGVGLDAGGIAERSVRCAILHITRIEDTIRANAA